MAPKGIKKVPEKNPLKDARAREPRRRDLFAESFRDVEPEVLEVIRAHRDHFDRPLGRVRPLDRDVLAVRDRLEDGMTLDDATAAFRGAERDTWVREAGFKLSVILGDRERFEALRDAGAEAAFTPEQLESFERQLARLA